jgi:nitrite reductase/ring-hydroxylating ferredoxin subunit
MNPTLKSSTTGMPIIELPLAELSEAAPTRIELDGQPIVLVRSGDQVFAYNDKCPHAFWPLSEGSLNNSVLECPGHGWEFDIKTGRCLTTPDYCLVAVPVTVEAGLVRLAAPAAQIAPAPRCVPANAPPAIQLR